MKEKILKLREDGKTYNEIQKILNCSKGTISYYLGDGQKEKTKNRTKKRRQNIIFSKLERFKQKKSKNIKERVRKFNKRDNNLKKRVNKKIEPSFTVDDILKKFGTETVCYLSGVKINLYENNYHFDHILPSSRGGDNLIDNLGVTHKVVNQMKNDLTPEELIEWCKKILEHNGYIIK